MPQPKLPSTRLNTPPGQNAPAKSPEAQVAVLLSPGRTESQDAGTEVASGSTQVSRDEYGRTKPLLPTSNARPSEDISSLDGLRGLAILLVLICHTDAISTLSGGTIPAPLHVLAAYAYSGVVLFFILSGFLLFLPYARGLVAESRWPRTRIFYLRRVLRILPLYYAALLVTTVAAVQAIGWRAITDNMSQLVLSVTLLYGLSSKAFSFATGTDGPLWSLTIEWQFYLVLPWIALLLALLVGRLRKGHHGTRPARLTIALVGLVALGLAARGLAALAHYSWGYPIPTDVRGPLGLVLALVYGMQGKYVEVFGLGMLASVLYVLIVERSKLSSRLTRHLGNGLVVLSVVGLAYILLWAVSVNRLFGWSDWVGFFPARSGWPWIVFGETALGAAYAALLLAVLFVPALGRRFSWTPLRFVGTISYSMYVWHFVILKALLPHELVAWPAVLRSVITGPSTVPGTISAPTVLRIVAAWVLVLMVSVASYYVIERPFLRLRYRRAR